MRRSSGGGEVAVRQRLSILQRWMHGRWSAARSRAPRARADARLRAQCGSCSIWSPHNARCVSLWTVSVVCRQCVCAVVHGAVCVPQDRNRWVSHTRDAPDEHIAECALRRGALPVDLCNGHAGNSYTRRRVSTVCLIRACSRRSGVRAGSAAECADESPRPGCITDPKYTILRTLAHLTRLSLLETCRLNPLTQ